jgi:hypothetical protein
MGQAPETKRQRWRRRERIVTVSMAVIACAMFIWASWIVRHWMTAGPIVDMRL